MTDDRPKRIDLTTATVEHRCSLCNEVLSREDLRPEVAERMLADHHAVCPKRPIEVGDYVRWEYGPTGPFAKPENWAEGMVVSWDAEIWRVARRAGPGAGRRPGRVAAPGAVSRGCVGRSNLHTRGIASAEFRE